MRNLMVYPITSTEIIACLRHLAAEFMNEKRCGDMRATLLDCAAVTVKREEQLVARLQEIITSMRGSSEEVPRRFIEIIEASIPTRNELGMPDPLILEDISPIGVS